MSKFFQSTLKKEKTFNRKKEEIISCDSAEKKKNTKKFMISPKDYEKDKTKSPQLISNNIDNVDNINNKNTDESEHIFNIINNDFINLSNNIKNIKSSNNKYENDSCFNIQNTNSINKSLSLMYNKYSSPLNTNIDYSQKNVLSTMYYNSDYDNKNINEINNSSISNVSNISKYSNYEPIDVNLTNNALSNTINYTYSKIGNLDYDQNNLKIEKNNVTTINKLNFTSLSCEPTLTFIQKDKYKLYNYQIMLDKNNNSFINANIDIPCYYCRRHHNNSSLGIPIKYYPSVYIVNNNNINNSKYSFNYKENVMKLNTKDKNRLLQLISNNTDICDNSDNSDNCDNCDHLSKNDIHKVITKNFFETDGVVCSFNCMFSFIEENKLNPIYTNSYNLMYLLYKYIFGYYPEKPIIRSPSWKLRKEYGGPLSDDDYEKYLQTIPIIESKQIKSNIKTETTYEVLI